MTSSLSAPNTCRNSPSFVRVPQMILVGFAAFVMENVPSVTMCLDQCTKWDPFPLLQYPLYRNHCSPPPETGDDFVCKSVMYYYNEQECILNSETRESKPDLFIPEGDDFQVKNYSQSNRMIGYLRLITSMYLVICRKKLVQRELNWGIPSPFPLPLFIPLLSQIHSYSQCSSSRGRIWAPRSQDWIKIFCPTMHEEMFRTFAWEVSFIQLREGVFHVSSPLSRWNEYSSSSC